MASGTRTQMLPPPPKYTEEHMPDLSGKVYIVTGANSGVGYELARLLYLKNGKVYVAARNSAKANAAIESIKTSAPSSTGQLEFMQLQLEDLSAVAAAAREFLTKESRLDVLFNNAGVMHPPAGSKTAQGHELQLGVHNLGHGLLTELLTPLLAQTTKLPGTPKDSVRVVWTSSLYAELSSPSGGFDPNNMGYAHTDKDKFYKYAVSKAGIFYQGAEYARRHKKDGIISVTANPGNLKSGLQRHMGWARPFANLLLYPAVNGAYTEVYAGLSPEVTMGQSGSYVLPWGRIGKIRVDLERGTIPLSEGGTGMAEKWFDWVLLQIRDFM